MCRQVFILITTLLVTLLTVILFVVYADRIVDGANDNQLVPVKWAKNIYENRYFFYISTKYIALLEFYALTSRMLIIQLKDGTIVIYNPTKLTPQLKEQIDTMFGKKCKKYIIIAYWISVNTCSQWLDMYGPDSGITVFAPPGVVETKFKPTNEQIKAYGFKTIDDSTDVFNGELIPKVLRGVPKLQEVVLYHPASKMLLTTDAALYLTKNSLKINIPGYGFFDWEMWFYGAYNVLCANPKIKVDNFDELKKSLDEICALGFKGITNAHGDVITPDEGIDVQDVWKKSWLAKQKK